MARHAKDEINAARHSRKVGQPWLRAYSCPTVTFYYNVFKFILPQICKILVVVVVVDILYCQYEQSSKLVDTMLV